MLTALNMEPSIPKDGAVSPHEHVDKMRYHEFMLSSNMLAVNHCSDLRPYQILRNVIVGSEQLLGYSRMWGAMELLLPYAIAKQNEIEMTTFMSQFTTPDDVVNLNYARRSTWQTSSNPNKKSYPYIAGAEILEHYHLLGEYGRIKNIPMIYTWAEQITEGLPIVYTIIDRFEGYPLNDVVDRYSSEWFKVRRFTPFSVGQLADYFVIALFDVIYDHIKQKEVDILDSKLKNDNTTMYGL